MAALFREGLVIFDGDTLIDGLELSGIGIAIVFVVLALLALSIKGFELADSRIPADVSLERVLRRFAIRIGLLSLYRHTHLPTHLPSPPGIPGRSNSRAAVPAVQPVDEPVAEIAVEEADTVEVAETDDDARTAAAIGVALALAELDGRPTVIPARAAAVASNGGWVSTGRARQMSNLMPRLRPGRAR